MALFEEDLYEILKFYEEEADSYKLIIESAPEGKLYLQKNQNGTNQLLHYMKINDRIIRRGVNKEKDVQKVLARKEFAINALAVLEHNIGVLKEAISKQKAFDPDSILKSMSKAYSSLPEDYFFDRESLVIDMKLEGALQAKIDKHKKWGLEPYRESQYHLENKNKRTSSGKYVRSKSELLIYESLLNMGIPFHYDEELHIDETWIVADFTFRDGNMKYFFWEHMGMMDDPLYAKKNFKKLNNYYDVGIIPGDNLIITFSRADSINMGIIKSVIHNEVIPKL